MAMRIETATLDDLRRECLALGFFSDERPPRGYAGFFDWRVNGMISKRIAEGSLAGSRLEKVLIASNGRIAPSKVLLLGLGPAAELTYDTLYTAGYTFSETAVSLKWDDMAFEIPAAGRCRLELPYMAEAVLTGFFDALAKEIGRLESLSPSLLIKEEFMDTVMAGVERFKKNFKDLIPVEIGER